MVKKTTTDVAVDYEQEGTKMLSMTPFVGVQSRLHELCGSVKQARLDNIGVSLKISIDCNTLSTFQPFMHSFIAVKWTVKLNAVPSGERLYSTPRRVLVMSI